ncbi:MAG: branched-chain amino acid ABC transporter permease [Limnochordales bacterium]|nr:branched-chain amino acid ABC transporter permease [Limnochordales bacterium]
MFNLELFINGIMTGAFYAVIAIGLTLIFGILKLVNFAHGEYYMVGAYAYTLFAAATGLSPWLGLPVAVAAGAAIALVMERLLMRPLYQGYTNWRMMKDEYAIIVTFGVSLFLMNLATQVIGPEAYQGPELLQRSRIFVGPILLGGHRLVSFAVAAGVLLLVLLFIHYTPQGQQIQAVAQNRFGASLAGINTARVSQWVFAMSGGLAALAGGLLSPMYLAHPMVGMLPATKSFVIVVLGGMGSVAGSLVGGLIMGVLEAFGAVYISYQYQDVFGFILLILVLMLRPWGLFGERAREL